MGKRVKRNVHELVDITYGLCNKHQWFTGGSTDAYEKMFSLIREGRPVNDIALAIWLCSHDVDYQTIYQTLEDRYYKEERVIEEGENSTW